MPVKDPDTRRPYDRDALAAYLGVSRRQINRLLKAGQLPTPFYVGTLPRWAPDVIDRWIAERGTVSPDTA